MLTSSIHLWKPLDELVVKFLWARVVYCRGERLIQWNHIECSLPSIRLILIVCQQFKTVHVEFMGSCRATISYSALRIFNAGSIPLTTGRETMSWEWPVCSLDRFSQIILIWILQFRVDSLRTVSSLISYTTIWEKKSKTPLNGSSGYSVSSRDRSHRW